MLIIIGDINIDINLALDHWPHEGGDATAHITTWSNGGTGLNSAIAVACMGGHPRLWGRVGTDPAAHQVRHAAAQFAIDVDDMQADATVPTGLCIIPVTPTGERTFLSYRGANTTWQLPDAWPSGTHWLHVCGHALLSGTQRQSAIAALQRAQTYGWQTSIDLCEPLAPQLNELFVQLPQPLTVLLGNHDEMRVAQTQTQHPLAIHAHTVITKQGADGCTAQVGAHRTHSAGFTIDAVDTTGCGDTFASICVWALMQHHPLNDALLVANAAGAITASRRGAADIMPRRAEVVALIRAQRSAVPDWLIAG
ncbi:MAG: carbohydrate kinase family protein [Chloroflexi bacterium]|nr:carbohydrate kinase family protein [Chloroflexota bacterium]